MGAREVVEEDARLVAVEEHAEVVVVSPPVVDEADLLPEVVAQEVAAEAASADVAAAGKQQHIRHRQRSLDTACGYRTQHTHKLVPMTVPADRACSFIEVFLTYVLAMSAPVFNCSFRISN